MSNFYKNISYDKALWKVTKYCAMQERCLFDVQNRFVVWHVNNKDKEKLINYLIKENYLNEERYIKAYVRGKFLIKKWGKNKIKLGLFKKNIFDEKLISQAFDTEISEFDYRKTIKLLMIKKAILIKEEDSYKKRDKIYRYLLGKGYESELVVKELERACY